VIEGLRSAIETWAPDGASELCAALEQLLGGGDARGRLISVGRVRRERVLRIAVEIDDRVRGLIVKRFPPDRARRERDAIERWLPRMGLDAYGPPLLATAADGAGRFHWFAYEDLGECTLADRSRDPQAARVAVDLGIAFYGASVRDATRALEALAVSPALHSQERSLCTRLLSRIDAMRAEEPERAELLAELGGAETFLHGDLWTINVLVRPVGRALETRLIDWDHAGVGPVSYDLSALLMGFPPEMRDSLLSLYRDRYEELATAKPSWPARGEWNLLFDTAERARLANAIVWRALGALDGHVAWALDELAWYEAALATREPVLPPASRALGAGPGGTAEHAADASIARGEP
jgi:hypothetical protein